MATLSVICMNRLVIRWYKAKFDAFRTLLDRITSARVALPKNTKHDFHSIEATEAGKGHEQLSLAKTRELWGDATFPVPAGQSPFLPL